MTAPQADPTALTSDIPDISHVGLDEAVTIASPGMSRIMRGISGTAPSVSAFNSSI